MTQIISFSELDAADQCSLKHQLAYVERWSKPQAADSALAKGSAWHQVMEEHYKAKMAGGNLAAMTAAGMAKVYEITDRDGGLGDLIEWMYRGYLEHWGSDPGWKILGVEHSAQVRLPTPRGGSSSYVLKVKIDLVVRDLRSGNILVVDHKSGKDLPGKKSLEFDDQFPLYTWAMQRLGKKVFGQCYNAARTLRLAGDASGKKITPLDERFARVPGYRTEAELETVAVEAYQRAVSRYREQRDASKAGIDSPRHTNSMTCGWRCDFSEPCLWGRKGGDMRQMLRDKGFRQDFERH